MTGLQEITFLEFSRATDPRPTHLELKYRVVYSHEAPVLASEEFPTVCCF